MVQHFVYITKSPETGEFYIGKHSTADPNDGYQGSGSWIRACKKSRVSLITDVVGEYATEADAFVAEATLVEVYRSDPLCRNLAPGGKAPPPRYGPKTPEECTKISEARRGMVFTESHREAIRKNRPDVKGENNPFYGRSHSAETRAAISARVKKRLIESGWTPKEQPQRKVRGPISDGTRKKLADAQRGKQHSNNTREKMSTSQKSAWRTREPISRAVCPHCHKEGNQIVMHRWHFDNCKQK